MSKENEIIIGIHSIAAALKNSQREHLLLLGTVEGFEELKKRGNIHKADLEKIKTVTTLKPHDFQEEAKKMYDKYSHTYQRIPSGTLLYSAAMEEKKPDWLYDFILSKGECRLLCLDKVTDVHNGAAIMRTAAFYGIDALIIGGKSTFGKSPSFTRIASGALECVPIVRASSLPKLISKLVGMGVECVGFSEHAETDELPKNKLRCLVMGAEDVGLSNAVSRILNKTVGLVPKGGVKSLNVSVASAIAMERYL